MSYSIIATGKGIAIVEFPLSVASKGVDAKSWVVDHLFKRSFKEKLTSCAPAAALKRFPIRALYVPSPKSWERGPFPACSMARWRSSFRRRTTLAKILNMTSQ